MFVLNFPEWEQFEPAFYEVNDHDAVMMASCSSAEGLAGLFTDTKMEAIEAIFGGVLLHAKRYFIVLVTAHTEREFNYRCKLLKAIMEKHGGNDLIEDGVIDKVEAVVGQQVLDVGDLAGGEVVHDKDVMA